MKARIVIAVAAALAAGAVNLPAQPAGGPPPPWVEGEGAPPPPGPEQNVMYFHTEIGPGAVVKNAPYSAQVSTEFTQVLADGNRIDRTQTGMVYRDSEGRTRREETIGPMGPLGVDAGPKQLVFINDPVAGYSYVLDPVKKTARKMPLPTVTGSAGGEKVVRQMRVFETSETMKHGPGEAVVIRRMEHVKPGDAAPPVNLGTRAFDAVQADGTRTTITIPAGQVGNQKAIEISDERWYSPQLQTMVMTRHSDPRMGDTLYQLKNINLEEPAHGLFEVPADYQVVEGKPPMRLMRHRPAK